MSREIWRLLEAREILQDGDERYIGNGHWARRCEVTGRVTGSQSPHAYRRRETIEDEPKWEEVKNRTAITWSMFPKLCRYEDGTFNFLPAGQIQSHHVTHFLILPPFPQASVDFETFWQRNKERLLDMGKEAARLIYEEARRQ